MQIIDNRGLLLRSRNPQRVLSVIPKAKDLGNNQLLVHWGLEEAKVLDNLGVKNVPSPILGRYKWPGIYKPFEHQRTTAAFLTMNRRAFCLSEAGTAKTSSVLWAADYLMTLGVIRRVLIVCPISIMRSAWVDDIFHTIMHRTVDIAHAPSRAKRLKIIEGDAEFVVINYDGVKLVGDALAKGGFDLIVADEATALKNSQSKRWKAFKALVKPDTWLWLMTGTPAAQSPLDAYGLAKLVSPERVPPFYGQFRDKVMTRITSFKWVPKPNAKQIVFDALQPAIRYTKKECLDLPDMLYAQRDVGMTKQQESYYNQVRKDMRMAAAGESITAVNVAAQLIKLLQIATGTAYTDTGEVLVFDSSSRLNALKEIIDEASHKVIVFAPFRHTIENIERFLDRHSITNARIDGSVAATKRGDIFRRFQQEEDPRVIIIQPQAAAHGVTLTAADTVVWYAPTTSVELYIQGNARAHRPGQRNPCTVVHLQGSPVEKRLYTLLRGNLGTHEALVDMYKNVLDDG